MTAAQRRAMNRRNALKSTGPNTPEGKERTRNNALKHGMCALELALPSEKADAVQNDFNQWIDHYQPVGPAEFSLVEDIAKAVLRLRRCARHEAAVVGDQVRAAQEVWSNAQEVRRIALTAMLETDPVTAVRELWRFGEGRRWLLDRWTQLSPFFGDYGCGAPALVREALHLLGMPSDTKDLKNGPLLGFKFKLYNAISSNDPDWATIDWLTSDGGIHPEYFVAHGRALPTPEDARQALRRLIAAEIAALNCDEEDHLPNERATVLGLAARAELPFDCLDNRLALRYETVARSARDKAMKTLAQLQDERYAFEAEMVAEPDVVAIADSPREPVFPDAPNEANPPQEPQPSPDVQPGCDPSTATNPDAPKGEPSAVATARTFVVINVAAGVSPSAPVVTARAADSPPA